MITSIFTFLMIVGCMAFIVAVAGLIYEIWETI